MKKVILSLILTTSLLITSCSASKGASPSEEAQTSSEATTEEATTTTTEVTTTTTEAKDPISSLLEVVEMANSALGKDFDTALAIVEDAFATSLTFKEDVYHEAGEDSYTEPTYYSYYYCDVAIEGYNYDLVCFCYHEDKMIYEINFEQHNPDSSELMNCYELNKAIFSSLFSVTSIEEDEYFDVYWTTFGPVDGVAYEVWFLGEKTSYNSVIINFILE